jgi:hypothetical protein
LSFQEHIMAIPDPVKTNFNTLLRAADDGNLALMECPSSSLCSLRRRARR